MRRIVKQESIHQEECVNSYLKKISEGRGGRAALDIIESLVQKYPLLLLKKMAMDKHQQKLVEQLQELKVMLQIKSKLPNHPYHHKRKPIVHTRCVLAPHLRKIELKH